jgi:hypothetical protein
MRRRELLKRATAAAGAAAIPWSGAAAGTADPDTGLADGTDVRREWVARIVRVSDPVLTHLASGTLKHTMPVEGVPDRRAVTHLEAVGRTLAGLAPWLALPSDTTPEGKERARLLALARDGLRRATDPKEPDALNFTDGGQPLVDAAFLAHAIVRAPQALSTGLDDATRTRLADRLRATRTITPGFNNWLLFSAMVEAALRIMGQPWDALRVDYAVRQHVQWYKGDGVYGDGPTLHWDYYNSFVIQPMLLDVLQVCADAQPAWVALRTSTVARATRFAAILERLIGPDGTFPPIGRSLAYRCGAFQLLAQMALSRTLPEALAPAQVRAALDAVIRRTLDAPDTFTGSGWLQIGLCGHQPGVGERYISTGSLYLCTTAFVPLGLPPSDPFWAGPGQPWTSRRAWAGEAFPIDHALTE